MGSRVAGGLSLLRGTADDPPVAGSLRFDELAEVQLSCSPCFPMLSILWVNFVSAVAMAAPQALSPLLGEDQQSPVVQRFRCIAKRGSWDYVTMDFA